MEQDKPSREELLKALSDAEYRIGLVRAVLENAVVGSGEQYKSAMVDVYSVREALEDTWGDGLKDVFRAERDRRQAVAALVKAAREVWRLEMGAEYTEELEDAALDALDEALKPFESS